MINYKLFLILLTGLCILAMPSAGRCQNTIWDTYIVNGISARESGHYAEAEKTLRLAVKDSEQFGKEDPRLAKSINSLGLVLHDEAKYAEAESLFKHSCTIAQENTGAREPQCRY